MVPKYKADKSKISPRLKAWPVSLIVEKIPEAKPYNLGSTEVMMACRFGEENKPKPKPITIKLNTINIKLVFVLMKASMISPSVIKDIPMDDTIRGSTRSESPPAIGEQITIITGWTINIKPACSGVNP